MLRSARRNATAVATLALVALSPAVAHAGSPGRWEAINPPQGDATTEVGWARAAPNQPLHILWEQQHDSVADLLHRTVELNGTLGAVSPIVANYATLGHPSLLLEGPGMRALFGAQRSTDTSDPVNGIVTSTSADNGATWTEPVGTTPDSSPAGTPGGTNSSIRMPDGNPLTFSSGSGFGVVSHLGLDRATPLVNWNDQFGEVCCTYGGVGVRDLATGAPVVIFNSNIAGRDGVYAQLIDAGGKPGAAPLPFPGIGTAGGGPAPDISSGRRETAAARVGGGIYVIHAGGGTDNHVLLWRVGNASPTTMTTGQGTLYAASAAATPDGRIWAIWSEEIGGTSVNLVAARSNPSVTKFGNPQVIAGPADKTRITTLDSSSQLLRLDIFASAFGNDSAGETLYHTQVLPPLTLTADLTSFRGGKARRVTFKVTDVGVPVSGVTVRVAGRSVTTAQNGKIAVLVPGPRKGAKYNVTATKTDYVSAKLRVTVRPAPKPKKRKRKKS